jgi:hypothetical protein
MPTDPAKFNSTRRLDLVLKHLSSVRVLDEYVHGGTMQKDVQTMRNQLRQALNHELPEGWEPLEDHKGYLFSRPRKKWSIVRDDNIALEVYLALPVGDDDDDDACVGLYVPSNWKKREQFLKKLKAPQGFDHVNRYADGEWGENSSIWKYVRYREHLGSDVTFDWSGFMKAVRDAVVGIVAMEQDIDVMLSQLG